MIDARGFSCPMPVVMVQKELKKRLPQSWTSWWITSAPWKM